MKEYEVIKKVPTRNDTEIENNEELKATNEKHTRVTNILLSQFYESYYFYL